jgi:predicted transcriptional regulator
MLAMSSMNKAVWIVREANKPLDVYEVAAAAQIDQQAARRALNRAIALRFVKLMPLPSGDLPVGRQRHLYGAGPMLLDEEVISDIAPVCRILNSPFAVAAGLVHAPKGTEGRVHRLDDDMEEAA